MEPSNTSDREDASKQTLVQWLAEPQTMIGLSAVLLSLCGLFVSIYETSLIRQEQRASVWPYIQIAPSFRGPVVAFHVSNTGVGPARIQAAAITYKGDPVSSWREMIRKAQRLENIPENDIDTLGTYFSYISGDVLPPSEGETHDIFRLTTTLDDSTGFAFVNAVKDEARSGRLDIEMCYCSVYNECWTTSLQRQAPARGSVSSRPPSHTRAPRGTRRVENCIGYPNSRV